MSYLKWSLIFKGQAKLTIHPVSCYFSNTILQMLKKITKVYTISIGEFNTLLMKIVMYIKYIFAFQGVFVCILWVFCSKEVNM